MGYQIKCDDYILYDHRDEELVVLNPRCSLEVNKVGSASFTILPTHPFYSKLLKLKSVFEIKQDSDIIFRGRMTADSQGFDNMLDVDLEGALAYTNDSIIPPFSFPSGFPEASSAENVVAYLLEWALDQHNAQVEPWQRLKLGNVTVADPNNVITRSSTSYMSTWDFLKSKLFESALGGYMVVRYEPDGNYVDYLSTFELTNTQRITFGENLKDIKKEADATETYSAIFPQGAEIETEDGDRYTLTIEGLDDGDLTDDLVKKGIFIYSKSAVAKYGWICVPLYDSKWSDVTEAANLKRKAMEMLAGDAVLLSGTLTFSAVDLHFSDEEIQSFRFCRNVIVDSPVHGVANTSYPLTKLDIDMARPQGTVITIGDTIRTMVDVNEKQHSDTIQRVESAERDVASNRSEVSEVKNQMLLQSTQVISDCESIILAALETYVETSNYEEFKQTVESQLLVMADSITMNFSETIAQITNVDGDLQEMIQKINKHFTFDVNGLTIRAGENTMNLTLDNDLIIFKKNGEQFGWWNGVDFHTGNIVVKVNERAQFGNFAFVPRSNGSLSFLKVEGGD